MKKLLYDEGVLLELIEVADNSEKYNKFFYANDIPKKNNLNAPIEIIVKSIGYEDNNLAIKGYEYSCYPGYNREKDIERTYLKKGIWEDKR